MLTWLITKALAVEEGVALLEPSIIGGSGETKIKSLTLYLQTLFPLLITLVSGIAVLVIVVEGVRYAASGIPGVKGEAKQRIMEALGGLLLALAAYVILKTINPALVTFNFSLTTTP